jgi:peptide/nickel transport system substrate-binding protein
MKMKYKKFAVLLLVASVLLASCGAAATTEPSAPPVVVSTSTVEATAPVGETPEATAPVGEIPEQPRRGGTLTYVLPSDIISFDPANTRELVSGIVNAQMFDYLTRLDAKGTAQPSLAKSWEVSDDNLTWTFHLVEGVKFHDGTPLNAAAVKKNLDRILAPDSTLPAKTLLAGVTEVNVIDDYTLELVTGSPFGPLPQNLSHYSLGIISPKALDTYDDQELAQHPVGSGPFKFVSYTPSESIILERNDDYWNGPAFLDQIIFKPVTEPATREVLLETGEADIVTKIPAIDVERLNAIDGITVNVVPFNRVFFVMLNNQKAPTDNVLVRQALNYAIDKEAIIQDVYGGLVKPESGPISSSVFGYAETPEYEYNPEKAKALLAEAGYPNGFTVKFLVPQGRYLGGEETSVLIQSYLADVGVTAEIDVLEWATYHETIQTTADKADFNMAFIGFSPSTNDADWMLYTFYKCDSIGVSNNQSFTCDPELDKLLDAGRFTVDPEKRKVIYAEVLNKIVTEARDIYLFSEAQITGVKDSVKGLEFLPVEIFHLELVWLSE